MAVKGLDNLNKALDRIARNLRSNQKFLGAVGVAAVSGVTANFTDMQSKWPALKESTKARRRNQRKSAIKILLDTGRLRNSIKHRVSGDTVAVGTNVPYAAAQHFGFKGPVQQRVRSHIRRIRTRDTFARIKSRKRKASSGIAVVQAFDRVINQNIPARPFMFLQDKDVDRIERMAERFVKR